MYLQEMRFLQLNLNHCEAAQCLLKKTVIELKVDVVLLSEQYKNDDSLAWFSDTTGSAAIWSLTGQPLKESKTIQNGGFAKANICGIAVYSCYIPPRYTIDEFKIIVDSLSIDAAQQDKVVIAGDFNAWSIEWGCPRTNPRGRALLEAFASLDIVLLNQGNVHTFTRNGHGSVIDIAFASSNMATRMKWSISEKYTQSDHSAIIIDIENVLPNLTRRVQQRVPGWKCNILDKEMFHACMDNLIFDGSPERVAEELICKITNACDMSMEKRRPGKYKQSVYWWNESIAQLRKECIRARRKFTRSRGRPENSEHHEKEHEESKESSVKRH